MVAFEPAILCLIPASQCREGNVTERVEVVLRMGLSTGVMGRNTRSENQVGGDASATLPDTHVRQVLVKEPRHDRGSHVPKYNTGWVRWRLGSYDAGRRIQEGG